MENDVYFIHFATRPEKNENDELFYQHLIVQKMPPEQARYKSQILSDMRHISQRTGMEMPGCKKIIGEQKDDFKARRFRLNSERAKALNHSIKGLAMRYAKILGLREVYKIRCDNSDISGNRYYSGQIVLTFPSDAIPVNDYKEDSELERIAKNY